MADSLKRQKLKADLASSREGTTAYWTALRQDLNVGAKLKRGVRSNPLVWYAGAALIGLLLSRIPARRRKVEIKGPKLRSDVPKEAGKAAIAVTVLKFALDFAKPALMRWVMGRYFGGSRAPRGRQG